MFVWLVIAAVIYGWRYLAIPMINADFNQSTIVNIFTRYGKIISSLNHLSNRWYGNLNGNPLPSDDYWFVITFPDGKEYKDHFTLKR